MMPPFVNPDILPCQICGSHSHSASGCSRNKEPDFDVEKLRVSPEEAKRLWGLNSDHTDARALHRVVRAMHDGECPKCHKVHPSDKMPFEDWVYTDMSVYPPFGRVAKSGWRCPSCQFEITTEEGEAALAEFAVFMERNLEIFETWRRKRRKEA